MVAAAPVSAPTRTAPLPTGNIPTPKKGAPEKHRLLALVPPEGIQRVEREQGDRVNVWPHLLLEEFVAMFVLSVGLVVFSTFLNAPLRELANANLTPNPSKAPWYFLGLQELLRYFHPMVAGISIPTFILVGLAAVPFVDRNPSTRPGDRKIAITMFTMLFMFGAVLDDHRLLLPRPRLQLGLAVGARGVLRPVSTLAASAGLVAAIAALVAVLIFAISFFVVSLRSYNRQQEAVAASQAKAAGLPPPTSRAPAVSRRDFFRKSLIASLLVFGAQFGGASVAFLWPSLKGGFGALIDAGDLAEIKAAVSSGEPFYVGTGRFYVVPYNGTPRGRHRLRGGGRGE